MELPFIWETLERTLADIESGRGDFETMTMTAQAGILLLLDYTPEEIIGQVLGSSLPQRALISWIFHEGRLIPGVDRGTLEALRECWDRDHGPEKGCVQMATHTRIR
ncbi:MAG: hypothetical protein KKB20_04990 [Proteobacteria bacterium]|nr:hypothetical protein [Pseudomonadota bacterium]